MVIAADALTLLLESTRVSVRAGHTVGAAAAGGVAVAAAGGGGRVWMEYTPLH